jgi:hypothetical protein
MAKLGNIKESLTYSNLINNETEKSQALLRISNYLAGKGNFDEAINFTNMIINSWVKSTALEHISAEFTKIGNWKMAEKTGMLISQTAERQKCWRWLAKLIKYKDGWQIALHKNNMLETEEARLFYLKGCAESINIKDIDTFTLQDSLPFFVGDSDSIEKLLQAYSQHEIFFNKSSKEKINRLNKTLNIQWALDIIAKFPKEESIVRTSSNLPDWIDQIPDEDDRDQISLWAKQVAKGKIIESEFNEKVKSIN